MKAYFRRIAISLSLCIILPGAQGSLVSTLHSFSIFPQGAQSEAALIKASDGNFYGTTSHGGTNGGNGTIFRMSPSGTLTTMHTFTGGNDGANPFCTLVQGTDGNLYGTCVNGGADGLGAVFKMSTSGAFTTLYSFTGGSGSANPSAGLIQANDGNFYGTVSGLYDYKNSSSDYGAIFRITPGGTLSTLYSFTDGSDGAYPICGLVQGTDGNLYGTANYGGNSDAYGDTFGTVFQVSTNGTFKTVYKFTGGSDGANPNAGLIQGIDGNLYGTATYGGNTNGDGTIFQVSTNGTFNIVHTFTNGSDGAKPNAGLMQANNGTLYGTATYGGNGTSGGYGLGTIFNVTTNGATFTAVHEFSGGSDGASPYAGLILTKDGSLFGTTAYGNTNAAGTIFEISSGGVYSTLAGFPGIVDGANPSADLARGKDGNLYGTAENGGATGNGAVFAATLSGAVTLLHSFGTVTDAVTGALLDGKSPKSKPVQGNDGNLYGTTEEGGAYTNGTVFKVTTNGVLTTLYAFTGGSDGGNPIAGLMLSRDGNLYGTTAGGGSGGRGTVFQISTNGTLTTLYSFSGSGDGATPYCTLVQNTNGILYGTCSSGGDGKGNGTIFQVTTNRAFATLYTFSGGSDGSGPEAGLIQGIDGNLYGTATYGGNANGDGTVFRVTTNGTFTTLWEFTDGSDGANPEDALVQGADGNLYGTSVYGGNTNQDGTIFQITTNGTFTTLWDFTGGSDGAGPDDGLVAGSNGTFYGLAKNGGGGGLGTLFLLNLAPALQSPIISSGTLTLNLNAVAGLEYQVQFTTNLAQPVWSNLGTPIVASSQNVQVQDSAGQGQHRFYRAELLP